MEHPSIPQPKTKGILGNLPDIDSDRPVQSFMKLAKEYGPIFRLDLPGGQQTIISGHRYVEEACDQSKFDKNVWSPLQRVRAFAGDGLFTSWTYEPNWKKAHHILLPSFSQRAMQGYHGMMVDIALQLTQKWARLNPGESVNVPDDMTRLTLDTIGLCGFNYRFNSFYREHPHPFVLSMTRALDEAMNQGQRLGIQNKLMLVTKRQFNHDIQSMFSTVDQIIAERRAGKTEGKDDLLAHMLTSKDPETGEALDDENIRYQIITFLIAGHETTSGLLSFAFYFLLKHPDKLKKAQEEVDRILTDPVPSYKQVRDLKYIRMILNESLRLWPTAPAFSLYAKEDTLLGGKYPIRQNEAVTVLIPILHRDKEVWGEEVEEFRPERFEDEAKIPHHAFKPFGNGQRACIGQQFALHEATLVLGMLLKHFEPVDHTQYKLKVKETLTLKPDQFTMQVKIRRQPMIGIANPEETAAESSRESAFIQPDSDLKGHDTPLLVLYGSNLGTAEGIARELADNGRLLGFRSEAASMDSFVGKLPADGAVLIVSASYNGNPPDNGRQFVEWLSGEEAGKLKGVRYAVFGCGDHNWASTYQKVPVFIDERLRELGAERLLERGEGDASGDFELQYEAWRDKLWAGIMDAFGLKYKGIEKQESTLSLRFVSGMVGTPLAETYDAFHAEIVENRELQSPESDRSTRHIEIALPEGAEYREGDHLGVLPRNPRSLIERVIRRFQLRPDDHLLLEGGGRSAAHLPLGKPVGLMELLGNSVELQETASRAQLREMAAFTTCPPHKKELEAMLEEGTYQNEIMKKRVTMLELLERYPACEMPFDRFLELLPPLKPRYYSISSSPKKSRNRVSITVAVVAGPARSGHGEYRGIASNYLRELGKGEAVAVFIRRPGSGFELPEHSETAMIMIGPGTGLAPFRGFLQARAAQREEGRTLGEAHLYFGCRRPNEDFLYKEELEAFEAEGIVKLHTAFSRVDESCKVYVQDRLKEDKERLIGLLDQGARLYVCGDGTRMAPDVEATLRDAYQEVHQCDEATAVRWLDGLLSTGQYAKDVWTGI
ncbi:cytochrome P450 [Paenibacillus faecis]|uniref:Bifunctional cytochrome P450/NADPH--P450 reductase n=1 Tax=Paenibacillus faecis TaxID=862114 RepID=A0A5D0CY51_9BACL|nr:bifunctional cytochrome P450/NADPH--P450 reductase [Paenibacillus faecis]TYA14962.1 cytochrome P450 [Paenibacillus faecis]